MPSPGPMGMCVSWAAIALTLIGVGHLAMEAETQTTSLSTPMARATEAGFVNIGGAKSQTWLDSITLPLAKIWQTGGATTTTRLHFPEAIEHSLLSIWKEAPWMCNCRQDFQEALIVTSYPAIRVVGVVVARVWRLEVMVAHRSTSPLEVMTIVIMTPW